VVRWADVVDDDFYTVVRCRRKEILVIQALRPSDAGLISLEGVTGSPRERGYVSAQLSTARGYKPTLQIYAFIWLLSKCEYWDRPTRLTVPLLLLDELMIHLLKYPPHPTGTMDIGHRLYPNPALLEEVGGPIGLAQWAADNFNVTKHLRSVVPPCDPPDTSLNDTSGDPRPAPEPHAHRAVTPDEGNPATFALYGKLFDVAYSVLRDVKDANTVTRDTLRWYFDQELDHALATAAPYAIPHARKLALISLFSDVSSFELAGVLSGDSPTAMGHVEALRDHFVVPSNDLIDQRYLVMRSLRDLTPEEAGLLVLRYSYDLSESRLASIMDCPVPVLRERIARARSKFVSGLEAK
jgi:hypothetical protein